MIFHREDSIKALKEAEQAAQEQAQSMKMLPLQLEAAVGRQEFIEDCIAEMAMALYAE